MNSLSPTELGVAAVFLLLALKELLNFARWGVTKFLPGKVTSVSTDQLRRELTNEAILRRLASVAEKQTSILQRIEHSLIEHEKGLKEISKELHEHVRDMSPRNTTAHS